MDPQPAGDWNLPLRLKPDWTFQTRISNACGGFESWHCSRETAVDYRP
jgi:hypothetical protein